MDQGKLNGKDFYLEFNLIVIDGLKNLAIGLDPKPVPSYDWPEHNGREYDFNVPIEYEDRDLDIECLIIANTTNEVLLLWNKFATEYSQYMIHDIYVNSLNRHYKVLFKSHKNHDWIKTSTGVGVKFTQGILLVPDNAKMAPQVIVYDGNGDL